MFSRVHLYGESGRSHCYGVGLHWLAVSEVSTLVTGPVVLAYGSTIHYSRNRRLGRAPHPAPRKQRQGKKELQSQCFLQRHVPSNLTPSNCILPPKGSAGPCVCQEATAKLPAHMCLWGDMEMHPIASCQQEAFGCLVIGVVSPENWSNLITDKSFFLVFLCH